MLLEAALVQGVNRTRRDEIGKGLLEQASHTLASGSMLFRQGIESAVKLGFEFLRIYVHSTQ